MKKIPLALFLIAAAANVAAAAAPGNAAGAAGIDQWMPFNDNGKWGFVARDSKKVEFTLPPSFEGAYPFRQGRAAVRKDKLWGFIDEKGNVVIPFQYDDVQQGVFRNGIAIVKKTGQYGVIDLTGKEVLPLKFQSITLDEKEGRLTASVPNLEDPNDYSGLHGLYDLTGKMLMPQEYSSIYPWFKGGVTVVEKGGKKALASSDGKLLTPLQYDQVLHSDISHYIAVREKEQVHDLYDEHGKPLFSATYPYVGSLADNRAVFKDAATKLFGYLDEKGKIALPAQFVSAQTFSEGLAVVKRATGGPVEVIDPAGKTIGKVPDVWIRLDKFKNGLIWLQNAASNKVFLYDRKLEKVFPQGFRYAADFDANGLARAQADDKKYGLINKKGDWVLQPEWTHIQPSSIPAQYIVTKDKEKAVVDATGRVLFKPQPVSLNEWDAQFIKVSPTGFLTGPDYFCFWRHDGVFFYNQEKKE